MIAAVALAGATNAAAAQVTVQITEQDCSRLVRHVATADTTYQPGVDVDGKPVAPADLDGGQQVSAPDTIVFPLTLDLADRLGVPPAGDADFLARPVIGEVAVTHDGRVLLNGVALTSDEQHELAMKCQRAGN